ncbi:MAG TPA: BatA domain-containing protein [Ignavibacteriales bacterium]|nr:BatA domain-containing protein [Ignavibacteriales bacterium]
MTFLNPAILFGLIATAIPVLLHLLNLRKLKRIEFSTLTFLKELQKNKIRRIKLKQWLLLALRFLIILFVVFSFARPTLQGVSIGGTTSSAKTTAVFILDNTFSMSVVSEKGSDFNRARQVIKTLLNEMQEGDEAALITVAGAGKEEVKTTTNLSEFRKKLDAVDLSYESGTINKALIMAGELLSESHNFNKEIYLLSDFQKTDLIEPNQQVSNLSGILGDKVKLYTFDFSGKDVFNLGIDNLEANNQIFEKGKPVSFTAQVTNYSSSRNAQNSVASLFINGERSAQQSVSLSPNETKNVVFETVLKSSGYTDIEAELEDDDIQQDNRRFMSLIVPDKVSVLILSDKDSDSKFVELALLASGENGTINITKRNFSQLSSVNPDSYDAVITIGSNGQTGLQKLKDYAAGGGSLFIMPGSSSNLENFRSLLSEFQLPEPTSMAGNPNSTQNAAVFDKIDFEHPVFADLFAKQAKKQVESPDVYCYFRLTTQGKGKSIITLPDNSSFLSEYSLGKGKVLLMNTAPVINWTNFPLKGLFAPVMNKALFYLASKDHRMESFQAGEMVTINLQKRTLPQIKITRPDKTDDFINLSDQSRNFIAYSNTNLAGNYRVFSGDRLVDYFSVNHSPMESNTRSLTLKEFNDYLAKTGFKGKQFRLDANENYTREIQQARFGSELWRFFLMLAFVLALVEMLVSRSAKKDIA